MQYSFTEPSAHRVRLEWSTRDAINVRQMADTVAAGSKRVTPAMLAAHPTRGANPMTPSASRRDTRPYTGAEYFPGAEAKSRPRLPPRALFQNPWLNDFDIENGEVTHELRGAVRENNRFITENAQERVNARIWTQRY